MTAVSPTDRHDGVTHDAFIELKCRRTHYDELLIERKKWDYLADIRARTGSRTLYINATPKGIYQWDLGALKAPQWVCRLMPAKTDYPNGDKIEKQVGFLHTQHAELLLV